MEAPGNVLLVIQIGLLGSDTQLMMYPQFLPEFP